MSRESVAKSPATAGRPKRTPVSGRNILSVQGKDENFEYRFVNDTGDRVSMFKEAGWETVPADSVRVGDRRVEQATSEGSIAQASISRTSHEKAVLMRIPKEWYEEDQLAKQKRVDELEQSTKQQALSTNELRNGKLEIGKQ